MDIIKNKYFHDGRNCGKRTEKVQYIVIHYTGSEGTAANNVNYFNSGDRGASAHYFVDRSGAVYEYCDPAKYYAWHCGGSLESSHHPYHGKCTNRNSIGIEICTHNNGTNWEFTAKAVAAAVELTKCLMNQFSVPVANVIRHYDVTGKACPRVPGWGAVGGGAEWNKFKAQLTAKAEDVVVKYYRVRKAWTDIDSQIGAYSIQENAIKCADEAGPKYAVFDWEGKEVYRTALKAEKEIQFYYPGYTRKESPYDSNGAGVVWYDQDKNALLIDAYIKGSEASNKLISFLLNNGLYNVSAVGTHAHGDHIGGIFKILDTPKLTLEHLYVYDPASLKLAGSGSANARSALDDKAYLQKLIDKAKGKGTKVHYVKTGDKITCGEIVFEVCRNQPTAWGEYDTGEAWQYLNDGSINLYERACHVLLCGDGGGKKAAQYFNGDIAVCESEHHGNGDGQSKVAEVKSHGCQLAIECNNEMNGPGSCGWTRYGAGRFRDAGITVWMLNADIKGVAKDGKLTVTHGSDKKTFNVPFGRVFYRVRKSWTDASSQIGAYTVLAKAKECVDSHPGYKVFSEAGKQIYPASASEATTAASDTKPQTDQEKFIAKIGPMAKADMAKTGICAAITIAQAILESGWGKSELAKNANNLFGMKKSLSGNSWSGSAWDGKSVYSKQTKEVYASGPATVQADFRAYPSWQASVNDHSAYLAGAKNGSALRYKGLVGCTDYKKAAQIIKAGEYATAPDYVEKLCKLVEQYGLTKYNTTYTAPKPAAAKEPYLVKVSRTIPILKAPAGSKAKDCPVGIYTIVEEKNGYGRLKSGAGWIQLSKTTKM